MFQWYADAQVCFAYLADIDPDIPAPSFMTRDFRNNELLIASLLTPLVVILVDG